MLAEKQLTSLAERRRLLVMEADLHRQVIATEIEAVRARLEWLARARETASAGKPWLAVGGVVAGLFAVRHWRKLAAWAPAALEALRWARKLVRR